MHHITPQRLRDARQMLGVTRQTLADSVGVHWRTMARYEDGDAPIPGPLSALIHIIMTSQAARELLGLPETLRSLKKW